MIFTIRIFIVVILYNEIKASYVQYKILCINNKILNKKTGTKKVCRAVGIKGWSLEAGTAGIPMTRNVKLLTVHCGGADRGDSAQISSKQVYSTPHFTLVGWFYECKVEPGGTQSMSLQTVTVCNRGTWWTLA